MGSWSYGVSRRVEKGNKLDEEEKWCKANFILCFMHVLIISGFGVLIILIKLKHDFDLFVLSVRLYGINNGQGIMVAVPKSNCRLKPL